MEQDLYSESDGEKLETGCVSYENGRRNRKRVSRIEMGRVGAADQTESDPKDGRATRGSSRRKCFLGVGWVPSGLVKMEDGGTWVLVVAASSERAAGVAHRLRHLLTCK